MPHAFSESEHPFSEYGHFSQVELVEKPWFLVVDMSSFLYSKWHTLKLILGKCYFSHQNHSLWRFWKKKTFIVVYTTHNWMN
jgi:hypothetical protein